MDIYRQGDVLLIRTETVLPDVIAVPRDHGRLVLAYGEVTGHSHAIVEPDAELLATPTGDAADRWLRVPTGARLTHEEHATISLPPGTYIVRTQVQYQPAHVMRTQVQYQPAHVIRVQD